jgi:hypothetical protein
MWTFVISGLALLLGLINFYFAFLRQKHALRLVFIHASPGKLSANLFPEFALVNSGTTDVIVTSLTYTFDAPGKSLLLPQTLEWIEGSSLLIPAGKGIHARITFRDPFSTPFIETGVYDAHQGCFIHELFLGISWVQNNGEARGARVHVADVGLDTQSRSRSYSKLSQAVHDLYKLKTM